MNKSTNARKYLKKEFGGLNFANMLNCLRVTDKITQAEIADEIGVSKGIICDIEKGRRLPTIEQAKDMAKYLGYPVEGFVSILIQDQQRKANLPMKVSLERTS